MKLNSVEMSSLVLKLFDSQIHLSFNHDHSSFQVPVGCTVGWFSCLRGALGFSVLLFQPLDWFFSICTKKIWFCGFGDYFGLWFLFYFTLSFQQK